MENELVIGAVVMRNTSGKHNKQYTVEVAFRGDPTTHHRHLTMAAHWGRIGGSTQSQVKDDVLLDDSVTTHTLGQIEEMKGAMNKLVESKLKKGYCIHERWWEPGTGSAVGDAPWEPSRIPNLRAQAEMDQRKAVANSVASRQLTAEW